METIFKICSEFPYKGYKSHNGSSAWNVQLADSDPLDHVIGLRSKRYSYAYTNANGLKVATIV